MTKQDEDPSCSECKFWIEGTDAGDQVRWGFCRRYPPTVIASDPEADEGAASVQAWTVLPHWCGEHKQVLQ